ncbi:hypothetical protein KEJ51_07550, partial [Candidatus Bathyarchaeota archaeon]|nr:hypothetical protein [Candidatus Bathyarchaeota archaeon]
MDISRAEASRTTVPDRANILLFVLNQLGEVVTELKLQKLVFQVQNEAKIPGGYRYFKHRYGPYSQELSMDSVMLMNRGLIEREERIGRDYPYWVFRITERGRWHFSQYILPTMTSKSIERMRSVLDKYSKYSHYELAEIIYNEWKIREFESLNLEIQMLEKDLQATASFLETMYFPECPAITYFLAFIEYSQEALTKIRRTKDAVVKSVLSRACRELTDKLVNAAQICSKKHLCQVEAEKGVCKAPDPSIYEIFDFIEDFCDRHGIQPKLSERELTEL